METQSNHPEHGTVAAADGASKPGRRFLGALAASIGGPLLAVVMPLRARASTNSLHLQDCRIAGSQYYDCDAVLPRLRVGDALRLRRRSKPARGARHLGAGGEVVARKFSSQINSKSNVGASTRPRRHRQWYRIIHLYLILPVFFKSNVG